MSSSDEESFHSADESLDDHSDGDAVHSIIDQLKNEEEQMEWGETQVEKGQDSDNNVKGEQPTKLEEILKQEDADDKPIEVNPEKVQNDVVHQRSVSVERELPPPQTLNVETNLSEKTITSTEQNVVVDAKNNSDDPTLSMRDVFPKDPAVSDKSEEPVVIKNAKLPEEPDVKDAPVPEEASSGWEDGWDAPDWETTPHVSAPVTIKPKTSTNKTVTPASVPGSSFLRLAGGEETAPVVGGGWTDGWGSLLDAATTITSTVGDGLSDVLESIANVPSPEELARLPLDDAIALEEKVDQMKEDWPDTDHDDCDSAGEHDCDRARAAVRTKHAKARLPSVSSDEEEMATPRAPNRSMADTLMSNVTGSRLVTGSLDVFESVGEFYVRRSRTLHTGRGAFRALTVNDAERRRFILDKRADGMSLSEALRERRDVDADGSETLCTYARHFDAFGGFAQLEGLEMLAANARKIMASTTVKDEKIAKTVDSELATVYSAIDDDDDDEVDPDDDVQDALRVAIEATGLRYSAEPLMQVLSPENTEEPMECLAHVTVHSIHCLHKCAQLIMVADPVPQASAFCRLTTCLLACLRRVADRYVQEVSGSTEEMTALLLESANSAEYIRQALSLLSPVLQYRVAC